MMKHTLFLTLAILGAAAAMVVVTPAQERPSTQTPPPAARPAAAVAEAAPTVKDVLDKFVKAIGGEATVRKQSSRVSVGTAEITAMGAKGTVEIAHKAPDKMLLVMKLPGLGDVLEGFDGVTAWSQDPFNGLREKSGTELAATKRDAAFYRDVEMAKGYSKMDLKGTEKVGGRDAYVIEATPPDSTTPDKLYFDKETALLVRLDASRESPQGTVPVQGYFEDYRAVDGIKMPFTIRQSLAGAEIIIRFTDVRHNAPTDDTKFAKPAK